MNEPRKIGRASLLLIKIILRMGWVGFGRKGLLTLQCTKQSQQERERERERCNKETLMGIRYNYNKTSVIVYEVLA